MICTGLDLSFWEVAKQYLAKPIAMNRGALTAEDIRAAIENRSMQLWGIHDGDLKAVMVTEIIIYPSCKRLRVVLVGGHEMDSWLDVVIAELDEFKDKNACDGIEILGRRGWVKKLASYGYQEYQTVVIK